jgi:plasmid replication initiation protein
MTAASSPFESSMPPEDQPTSQLALALLFEQEPEILKTQRLAFNAMLKHALEEHAKNPEAKVDTYSMSRLELMRIIDYKSPNRKHLKEALTQMQDLKVQWDFLKQDGESVWASCVLLPYVGFDRDRIFYSYAPQIKPLLFDSKIYARLDLRIQRQFNLDPSAALYEWVNRFRTNPSKRTTEMKWEDWRWVIYGEIGEKSIMHEYKMFKRDKLKPAINEINERSDLNIELIENRDGGRSVRYLQFIVEEKAMFRLENEAQKEGRAEWDKRLEDMGMLPRERQKLLARYSVAQIEAHWRYTMDRVNDKAQRPIKNTGAYLKRALEGNYAGDVAKPPVAAGPSEIGSLDEIRTAFVQHRNDEAAAMYTEMSEAERAALVSEYNEGQEKDISRIPMSPAEQKPRHLIPFYSWLAAKTWGDATAQELFEFGIKTGSISLNKPEV